MKKIFKGLTCLLIGGVLALSAAGCTRSNGTGNGDGTGTPGSSGRNPETSPLRLAIGAVDQKFNPLFYTSANDGTIANMTQVSLITADKDGVFAFGDDYPTVALDYKETYYDAFGTQIGTGNGKGSITGTGDNNGTTSYEFLIKNGMKFSDGVDLTVMDVLFNMYVYLDPVYSGSNTMYSTKIKGLQAYRQQDDSAGDNSGINMAPYYAKAQERMYNLIDWSDDGGNEKAIENSAQMKADLAKVKELYLEELNTDWNATATGWVENYGKEYRFTEAWEAFYLLEGVVSVLTEKNENNSMVQLKDENGKYYTTLDEEKAGDVWQEGLIKDMKDATTAEKVKAYMDKEGVSEEDAKLALQKELAIKHTYDSNTAGSQIQYILRYCATSSTAYDYFVLDAMSQDRPAGELTVPRISGITVSHGKEFNGKTYTEDHDILKITINGIDPKAKWNFGVTVAPMHYYSEKSYVDKAMEDYTSGRLYEGKATNFGVKYRDINWFSTVLQDSKKNGVPVGAGAYQCSTSTFSTTGVTPITFFKNNITYFTRNDYFYTMGKNLENAKIKNVQYKVYRDDKIVEALKTGEIDYGEPTATSDNQRELNTGTLKQITYLTGGYGYVGINPKYVEDIEVRRAIMHAFDTSSIVDYYGEALVNLINAPVSTTSWAYPKGVDRKYKRMTDPEEIKNLVASSGNWTFNSSDGLFYNNNTGNALKIAFVIAGESTDHPSYQMMVSAKNFLAQCGFQISVETRVDALKRLNTGDLEVWAAAWSTSIDPDPYQIYSINSNASSTKNWNKDGIMSDSGAKFGTEQSIVAKINEYIDEGRQTLEQSKRAEIYAKCFDEIMNLAVEFPTYQRYDLCVYNSAVLDVKTMHSDDASFNMGPISELWKVNYL